MDFSETFRNAREFAFRRIPFVLLEHIDASETLRSTRTDPHVSEHETEDSCGMGAAEDSWRKHQGPLAFWNVSEKSVRFNQKVFRNARPPPLTLSEGPYSLKEQSFSGG